MKMYMNHCCGISCQYLTTAPRMHLWQFSGPAVGLLFLVLAANTQATDPSKRGICFVPNATTPQDDAIWLNETSNHPTWYYNYKATPSTVFSNYSQSDFEFVPMLWGNTALENDISFLNTVEQLVNEGLRIQHVLTFNEPDFPNKWGGSELEPQEAAQTWVKNIVPLQKSGIKVGLPAVATLKSGLP